MTKLANRTKKVSRPSSETSAPPQDLQMQFSKAAPDFNRLHHLSSRFPGGLDATITDLKPPPLAIAARLGTEALITGPSVLEMLELLAAERFIEIKAQALGQLAGAPVADLDFLGPGRYVRRYQGVDIYFSPQTGAHEVHGDIRAKYNALQGADGILRLPLTDEQGTPDGVGRYNHFEGGSIYWTPNTGPMAVHGAIRDLWASQGWERSFFGYPVVDQHRKVVSNQAAATPQYWTIFQNGAIFSLGNQAAPALVAELPPHKVAQLVRSFFDAALHETDDDLGIEGGVNILRVTDWRFGFWASGPRQVTFEIQGFHSNPIVADTTFRLELTFEFGLTWGPSFTEPVDKTFVIYLKNLRVDTSGIGHGTLHDRLRDAILDKFKTPFPVRTIPAQQARLIDILTTRTGGAPILARA
jgi:hypothetical protein